MLTGRVARLFLAFTAIVAVFFAGYWWAKRPATIDVAAAVPPQRADIIYVGSETCRDCHADQHRSWHRTYHRTMTQLATPENVLPEFDVELELHGQHYKLFRKNDTFWVEMDDPEWERAVFQAGQDVRDLQPPQRTSAQIVMTTGSHHFQAYWMRSEYGRELWQFPLRYDLTEQTWVHRKDVFLGPPEWRPGMHFKVWNDNCIFCHATGGEPGLDPATHLMANTRVAELGISCESCHGPGRAHVELYADQPPPSDRSAEQRSEDDVDSLIINPTKLDHELASQICGSCHANFLHDDSQVMLTGPKFRPGRRLTEFGRFFRPELETDDQLVSRFWADGVNRSTGREYMGLQESPCFKQGTMSCLSCHSMHQAAPDDQLSAGMRSNAACLQCHAEMRGRIRDHTHHAPGSSGNACYNCHMPYTNYGLFKATRSHQITSPQVSSIQHKSRPNACNLCHLDRTLRWTATHLSDWYGHPSPELQSDEETVAAWVLWALRGDAGQRVIAAWHARWEAAVHVSGSRWLIPILEQLAEDAYSAIRYVAQASLTRLPSSELPMELPTVLGIGQPNSPYATVDDAISDILFRQDKKPIASVE